jgi:hypothetical protein
MARDLKWMCSVGEVGAMFQRTLLLLHRPTSLSALSNRVLGTRHAALVNADERTEL